MNTNIKCAIAPRLDAERLVTLKDTANRTKDPKVVVSGQSAFSENLRKAARLFALEQNKNTRCANRLTAIAYYQKARKMPRLVYANSQEMVVGQLPGYIMWNDDGIGRNDRPAHRPASAWMLCRY